MTNGEKFKEVFGFDADGSRVIAVNATWWDCEFRDRKPITNANRIRVMTNEELADFLFNTWKELDAFYEDVCEKCPDTNCQPKCWLDWLKRETRYC